MPQSVDIGATLHPKRIKVHNGMDVVNIDIQIIPMRPLLTKFLQLPNVFDTIVKYMRENENSEELTSGLQCEIWRYLKDQFSEKIVLPLLLYFDDFEINNPLGSHSGINKIGVVYYTIPSIPNDYSSLLENIFLLQMHNTKYHQLHVVENICFDVMHDIFEGICRYEIAKFLNILINRDRLFSLNTLNDRIRYFDPITNNENIPLIVTSASLKKEFLLISASEMSTLVKFVTMHPSASYFRPNIRRCRPPEHQAGEDLALCAKTTYKQVNRFLSRATPVKAGRGRDVLRTAAPTPPPIEPPPEGTGYKRGCIQLRDTLVRSDFRIRRYDPSFQYEFSIYAASELQAESESDLSWSEPGSSVLGLR
ncbi:hypothetical protein X777_16728 [Ooceraea biroi]|uniref:Uncharacterized protein n=1 Tax=Ooceraea biroi TaxID=2015173 RepID=A0A026WUH0_OOCBI|nr:hypothetical protein X777_16728 [Ooceraea biroi]